MPASQQRLTKGRGPQSDQRFSLNENIPRKYNGILQLNPKKLQDLHELVDNLVPRYVRERFWEPILGPIDPNVVGEEAFDEPDRPVPIDELSSRSHVDYI